MTAPPQGLVPLLMECLLPQALAVLSLVPGGPFLPTHLLCDLANLCLESSPLPNGCSATRSASHFHGGVEAARILQRPLKAAEVREKRACMDCVHRKLSHPESLVRTWAGCQIFSHPPPRAPPSFPRLPQIWGVLSSLPSPLSHQCARLHPRPEKRRQGICDSQSSHQPRPERAPTLGVQAFSGGWDPQGRPTIQASGWGPKIIDPGTSCPDILGRACSDPLQGDLGHSKGTRGLCSPPLSTSGLPPRAWLRAVAIKGCFLTLQHLLPPDQSAPLVPGRQLGKREMRQEA